MPRPLELSLKWARRHGTLTAAVAAAFTVMLVATFIASGGSSLFRRVMALDLGEVVPEDVIVDRDISYVDGAATALKRAARSRLVPPVFQLNEATTAVSLRGFGAFRALVEREAGAGTEPATILKRLEAEGIIGRLDSRDLALLVRQERLPAILDAAAILLQQTMVDGVFATEDLDRLRPDLTAAGALVIQRGGRARQEVPAGAALTVAELRARLAERTATLSLDEPGRRLVVTLVARFAEANCSFDVFETGLQRARVADEVQPVMRSLVKGQVIARKGDLVTEDVLEKVRAMGEESLVFSLNSIVGSAFYLLLLLAVAVFGLGQQILGEPLQEKQLLLALALVVVHYVLADLLAGLTDELGWLPLSVLVPTASFTMLATLLVSARVAVVLALILSLALLLAARMDVGSFLFALLSGLAGCAAVQRAQRRIDLVRAGFILAPASVVILLVQALLRNVRTTEVLSAVLAGAANGFGSGLLVLGFLPLLEHVLNAPTRFRLMELSDLNAPVFKKMLNQATGTYNHSLAVASLAESACNAIGANAAPRPGGGLLPRHRQDRPGRVLHREPVGLQPPRQPEAEPLGGDHQEPRQDRDGKGPRAGPPRRGHRLHRPASRQGPDLLLLPPGPRRGPCRRPGVGGVPRRLLVPGRAAGQQGERCRDARRRSRGGHTDSQAADRGQARKGGLADHPGPVPFRRAEPQSPAVPGARPDQAQLRAGARGPLPLAHRVPQGQAPMNTVQVTSRGISRPAWLPAVRRYCRAVLAALATDGWELSVLVAGDEVMRELNRSYRGIDAATDVLSFSQAEGEPVPSAVEAAGDIVIALPTAERQAAEAGVTLEEELRRLLVHGILHLKGLDHPEGSHEMLEMQDDLLGQVEERLF